MRVTRRPRRAVRIPIVFRAVVAGGLIVDACVHAKLASDYDLVEAGISEGNLFRLEAVVAAVVAVLVLSGRRTWLAVAAVVAASAVAVLIANTYRHVGPVGPLPDMYEPTWFAEKRFALIGESVAVLGALVGLTWTTARLHREGQSRTRARKRSTAARTRA
jgi:drug/metabolite transporter (DMT)-like permease